MPYNNEELQFISAQLLKISLFTDIKLVKLLNFENEVVKFLLASGISCQFAFYFHFSAVN